MPAKIINYENDEVTVEIKVKLSRSMLSTEEKIQEALNEGGVLLTENALEYFDTDGSPIMIGKVKLTSMGKIAKEYETPYGKATVTRHLYQSSQGGKTYCPLENDARIIVTSTPKFAKMVSHKYGDLGSSRVASDLFENHGRKVVRSFIQNITEAVSNIVVAKEETWSYKLPETEKEIKSISIGLDGTMLLCKEGYREAMVGSIGFYSEDGERQYTIYTAASPEYGKETFLSRLEREVLRIKKGYPKAKYIGLADGSSSNWTFLEKHTDIQTIDFWHVTEYLGDVANIMYKGKKKLPDKKKWLDASCHNLKHITNTPNELLNEMKVFKNNKKLSKHDTEVLNKTTTYFKNQKSKMNYPDNVALNYPIGSGITEAACKVIVKQRLCCSGMRWVDKGASVVLSIRTLSYSNNRWEQFWNKIDQYGCSIAA